MIAGNPVNSRNDIGEGTGAIVVENFNSNNLSVLSDTAVPISVSR